MSKRIIFRGLVVLAVAGTLQSAFASQAATQNPVWQAQRMKRDDKNLERDHQPLDGGAQGAHLEAQKLTTTTETNQQPTAH